MSAATTTAKAGSKQKKTEEKAEKRVKKPLRERIAGGRDVRVPSIAWSAAYHGLVLAADYLILIATAVYLLPNTAVWLHQESGAANLTADGLVSMWVVPLAFLALAVLVGEIACMTSMWRWANRRAVRLRIMRGELPEETTSPMGTAKLVTNSKTTTNKNERRSK